LGTLVFPEPKNASRRTEGLPPRAVQALQKHRKRQLEEKVKAARCRRCATLRDRRQSHPQSSQVVCPHFLMNPTP
jgi:hypothetical protein